MTDRRKHRVHIDVPAAELALWRAAADRAGLPLEAFIKRVAFRSIWRDKVARRFGLDPRRGWWRL